MIQDVIAEIDKKIVRLQQARDLLAGTTPTSVAFSDAPRRGRPKGSKNAAKSSKAATSAPAKPKRVLSAEGRARISAAMKKRHAAKKRAAKKATAETA